MKSATVGSGASASREHDRQTRIIGIACGITIIFLFSGFTLVSRLGFASSLKLIDIAALRFAIGGLLLLPVLLRHGFSGIRPRGAAAPLAQQGEADDRRFARLPRVSLVGGSLLRIGSAHVLLLAWAST